MEDLEFGHSATESQFKRTIFMISISYSGGMLIFDFFVSEILMNFFSRENETLNLAKNELCAISLLNTSIKYLFSCGLETKSGHTDVTIWTSVTYELLF